MPVNDHALDNLFRDKEQERIPDTGQMPQHWQQMLQMLPVAPVVTAPPKAGNHLVKWAAGIAVTALVVTCIVLLRGSNGPAAETPATAAVDKPAATTEQAPVLPVAAQPVAETKRPPVSNNPAPVKPGIAAIAVKKQPARSLPAAGNSSDEAAFDAFYIHLSKPPQVFSINAAADTVIACNEGTKVKLPAGVFVDAAGNRVSGDFSLIVQEYYRYEDMIAAGIGEKAGGRKITAGMAKVEAYRGEEKLHIRDGHSIEIQMHPGIDKSYLNRNTGAVPDAAAPQQELSSKTISTLGWISTYEGNAAADTRPKTNLVIRFGSQHNPQHFMSQLAFANAVMPGYIEGQQIVFSNVPLGETVFLVSLGNVNNQYLSCIKKIVVGHEPVTGVNFSPTSPEKFRQQLELLTSLPVKE